MTIQIYNPDGKRTGEVVGNIYFTRRKPEHFMKKFQGFGISEKILSELQELKVEDIEITYFGVNGIIKYNQKIKEYLESNLVWIDKKTDIQRFVSLKKLNKGDANGNN